MKLKAELKDKLALAAKIQEAADLHTNKGWCRQALFDGKKKACAVGHLLTVYGVSREAEEEEETYNNPAIQPAAREIAKDLVDSGRGAQSEDRPTDTIVEFNDNEALSPDDVALQFSSTALRLKKEVFAEVARAQAEKEKAKEAAAEAKRKAEWQKTLIDTYGEDLARRHYSYAFDVD